MPDTSNDALEELTQARETWKRYTRTMHRLIGIMVACWLASAPIILYMPVLLVVSLPGAAVSGIVAWWTHFDYHHGEEVSHKDRWGDLDSGYRKRIPGPHARLLAAEAAYRRTLQ